MPAKKKKKDITLDEFKAWLEGVEELQPTGWAPDANQWKLIRNKIECIVEKQMPVAHPTMGPVAQSLMPRPAPTMTVSNEGLNVPAQAVPHTPQMPLPAVPQRSALDGISEAEVRPAAAASPAQIPLAPGPDGKGHTPNIDTSDGSFQSSFE